MRASSQDPVYIGKGLALARTLDPRKSFNKNNIDNVFPIPIVVGAV